MLEPALGSDWTVPVPGLEFTVASVVAHVAQAPLWYSVDLWSGRENAAFEVKVLPDAANETLLASLMAAAVGVGGRRRHRTRRRRPVPPLRLAGSLRVRRHGV